MLQSLVLTAGTFGALALAQLELGLGSRSVITVTFLTLAFAQLWHVFNAPSALATAAQRSHPQSVAMGIAGPVLGAVGGPALSAAAGPCAASRAAHRGHVGYHPCLERGADGRDASRHARAGRAATGDQA